MAAHLYAIGAAPINSTGPMQIVAQLMSIGRGPIVSATLVSVIFADGQFAGMVDEQKAFDQFQFVGIMDEQRAFDQFVKKIKAVTEVGVLAKTRAWDQVEALAQLLPKPHGCSPPSDEDGFLYNFRQLTALLLAQERKIKSEAAAAQLAELYSSLPTLWK